MTETHNENMETVTGRKGIFSVPPFVAACVFLLSLFTAATALSLCGDIDGDGLVSQDDVESVMGAMAGGSGLSGSQQSRADTVVSGENDIPDGTLLSNDLFILSRASEGELVLGCDEGGIRISGTVEAPPGVPLGESAGTTTGDLELRSAARVSVYRSGILLQRAITDSRGRYTLTLAPDELPGEGLIVEVGQGENIMRAFVTGETADLDPAAEFVTQNLISSGRPISSFTLEELDIFYRDARSFPPINYGASPGTIATAVNLFSTSENAATLGALISGTDTATVEIIPEEEPEEIQNPLPEEPVQENSPHEVEEPEAPPVVSTQEPVVTEEPVVPQEPEQVTPVDQVFETVTPEEIEPAEVPETPGEPGVIEEIQPSDPVEPVQEDSPGFDDPIEPVEPDTATLPDTTFPSPGDAEPDDSFELPPPVMCPGSVVSTDADSGPGSLRECINEANENYGHDTITFDPVFFGEGGTIYLDDTLPDITDDGTKIINSSVGEVIIRGFNRTFDCFVISSSYNEIRGLTVVKCKNGINVSGPGANNNTFAGNFLGTDSSGTSGLENDASIAMNNGASYNTAGGDTETERNIIVASTYGVKIVDNNTSGNMVLGNYICTDPTGSIPLGKGQGVFLFEAHDNIIGGPGDGNLISGCKSSGIYNDTSDRTSIKGNLIGVDYSGTAILQNESRGIYLSSSDNVAVGGSAGGEGNIISGNKSDGVRLSSSNGARIRGNYIGTDESGLTRLPNKNNGIKISGGSDYNVIGGPLPGEANIIAYNLKQGIHLFSSTIDYTTILRNRIYENGKAAFSLSSSANNGVESPTINSIALIGTGYNILGTIDECRRYPCVIELFRVDDIPSGVEADLSGSGEAFEYIDSVTIYSGRNFSFSNTSISAYGTLVSATLTNGRGDTSELSTNYALPENAPPVVIDCTFDPYTIPNDGDTETLMECTVSDPNGEDDVVSVTVNLSEIGDNQNIPLEDMGNGTWRLSGITAGPGTLPGPGTLAVQAEDSVGNYHDFESSIQITNAPPEITSCSFTRDSVMNNGFESTTLECDISYTNAESLEVTVDLSLAGGDTDAQMENAGGDTWQLEVNAAPAAEPVPHTFAVTAKDSASITTGDTPQLSVVNTPPEIESCSFTPDTIMNDGSGSTLLECKVNDINNDALRLSVNLLLTGGNRDTPMEDMGNGIWKLNVTAAPTVPPLPHILTVTAKDSYGDTDTVDPELTVENASPVITRCTMNPPSIPASGHQETSIQCEVSDINGDSLAVTVDMSEINGPAGEELSGRGNGIFRLDGITASLGTQAGLRTLTVTATDSSGGYFTFGIGLIVSSPEPFSLCSTGNSLAPHMMTPTPDGELFFPLEAAVDHEGNIYVTNLTNNRIEKFDSECNFVKNWGKAGSGPEQFNQPGGIVFNQADNLLYISDKYNYIRVFDTDGNYMNRWKGRSIVSIATDREGNLYVTSAALGGMVYKYNTDGEELDSWASPKPGGIAVADSGDIFVSEPTADTVHRYNASGELINSISGDGAFEDPRGIHVDGSVLYVVNYKSNRIDLLSFDGSQLFSFGELGVEDGFLMTPTDFNRLPGGNVVVVEQMNDRIQVFSNFP